MQILKEYALNVLITVKYVKGHKIIVVSAYKVTICFQSRRILLNAQNACFQGNGLMQQIHCVKNVLKIVMNAVLGILVLLAYPSNFLKKFIIL